MAKVIQISNDEDSSAKMLEEAILSDGTITSMILKKSNSAFYKGNAIIEEVDKAVVRIGFSDCRKMVMSMSLIKIFSNNEKCFGFDRMKFWLHSIAVGVLTEMLCQRVDSADKEQAFIAGLLHDFGKLILDDYLSLHFQKALHFCNLNELTLYESEKEIFEVPITSFPKK